MKQIRIKNSEFQNKFMQFTLNFYKIKIKFFLGREKRSHGPRGGRARQNANDPAYGNHSSSRKSYFVIFIFNAFKRIFYAKMMEIISKTILFIQNDFERKFQN